MDKVSIIMPVYNCEKFLGYSIESVQAQDYRNWELIIVNDASTDKSLAVAQEYAAKDYRIKVVEMPRNGGVSEARNLGLQYADGEYVAFLDSDDVWATNKLSKQIAFMRKNNYELSHTAYAFMNERGAVMENGKVDVDLSVDMEKYMKTTQIGMSTVIIDRRKVGKFEFPHDRKLSEDARLWMNFMRKGHKFHGLNEALLLYRVRESQISGNKLKMAKSTLKRYWDEKNFPAFRRLCCFLNYACNGVLKRIVPAKINAEAIAENFSTRRGPENG